MSENPFVHLHLHTEYSLLDGFARIDQVVDYAKELGMPGLAITDHGTMFGVIDFFRACQKAEVKPIIGVEAYLANRTMHDRDPAYDKKPYHMLLLAENMKGYENLLKLVSEAQLRGFYYRPRIDHDLMAEYSEGIIATSGCLAAEIPRMVEQGDEDRARELLGLYQETFGPDNFFLELQAHEIPELDVLNRWLVENSRYANVPLLATNDVHYVRPTDTDVHDTLLCIQTGSLKHETNRMAMTDDTYYLRSQAEMWDLFSEVPEALTNSLAIMERCNVDLDHKGYHLPVFPVPPRFADARDYLRYLCEKGLYWRYGDAAETDARYRERLDHELHIIDEMGFNTYFLIVWDLCEFARHKDIWWNVRGSGAGSLVAYTLGITNLDPIENGLIFERFLNPGRVSMPDFDLDYPEDRRIEMIDYCTRKYGADKVAAIITFGTLGAKAAIRDEGRALDVPLPEVDAIARTIPTVAKLPKIPKLIADDGDDAIPDLRQLYKTNPTAKHIIDLAAAIEGVPRHASTHAAGIIVGDRPLVEYLPLHRPTKGDTENSPVKMVTQFPMETAESIGLLKIDFLGLSTLTILRRACELVERYHGIRYDMSNIPIKPDPNDPEITRRVAETFEMIGRGETIGVFQIESSGMRQMLTDMRPQTFEHIIAAISLYRPGPMDQIPTFNRRLHGEEAPQYHHEKLKPILENTFGILVYQEQIMQVASDLFGYSLADADLMRRAVSKKKEEELLKHRQIFIENGPKHGVNAETSAQIFADIEFFARYGFNKCVVGDTQILDATTGRRLRVADLFAQPGLMQQTVALDTDTWRLTEGTVTDVMANGVKSVYRLRTRLGKQIEATANHPFLTFEGWRWLGDLQPGDRIATPRRIPVEGAQEWPAHQINVLGYLLAEGNLCHPHGVYFYTGEDDQCAQYVQNLECFANTRATVAHRRGMAEVYSRRAAREHPAEVVTWLEDLGLRGKTAHQKFIPPAVFELTNAQIGILLARMWEGNGHVNLDSRNLYYATASEQLARDMQHLLLRFGIISRLREVIFPYKEGPMGYQVFITGMPNIAAFARHIGQHFITPTRRERLAALQIDVPFKSGTRDTLPMGVKALVHEAKTASGLSWTAIGAATGLSITPFNRQASDAKQAFKRETIAQLATFFEDENLHAHAHSDVYWDTVESIEYIGEQPTYDLTVAGLHNFIADDIIVHNSHAADYAVITCQTAYLKCHYPHEYMSALMSVYYDDSTKVGLFIADCIRMGIKVLPPDVNRSFADFSIEEDHVGGRHIRFGLGAIKNLGQAAIQYLITQRGDTPFADLDDFLKRCEVREVGKRGLEALIKVGALDEISQSSGKNRADVLANLENISRYNAEHFKNAAIGQVSMFDLLGSNDGNSSGSVTSVILAAPPKEWTAREQLRWEKELVGIYVSGHPLTPYWEVMVRGISHTIAEVHEAAPTIERKAVVTVGGLVVAVRTIITRKGDTMAFMTLEDLTGKLDVVVFPEVWANHGPRIMEDEIFLVRGHVEIRGTDVQLQAVTFLQQLDNNPVAESVSMFPKTHEKTDALLDEETGEMQSPTLVTAAANGHRAAHGNGFSPAGGVQQMTFASTAVDVTRTQRPLHDKEGEPHSGQEFTPRYPNEPTYAPDEWRETHEDVHRLKGNEAPARDFSPSESAPTPPPKEPKEPNDYAEFGQLQLRILIERAPDLERDRRRLREIYGYVSQFPGPHKFIVAYMALNSGEGKYLDFAETQIMIHDAMVEGLFLLEGVIDVQVRDLDQRGK